MNVRIGAGVALSVWSGVALAQQGYPICVSDRADGRVCIRTQGDANTCGYAVRVFGAARPSAIPCEDAVVERFTADGRLIFQRVLAGQSEDVPRQVYVDGSGNAVVIGTTWSADFPVTADAVQRTHAGPKPSVPSMGRIEGGGDLFLTVLSPAGQVVYSTFLGSPGNDDIVGIDSNAPGQFDVVVRTPGLDFPTTSTPAAYGPVLVTVDIARHAVVRSQYLPLADPGEVPPWSASWQSDGSVLAVSSEVVARFARDGRMLSRASFAWAGFYSPPQTAIGTSGDIVLAGTSRTGESTVVRYAAGEVEAFRWTLPMSAGSSLSQLLVAPDGRIYVRGMLSYPGRLSSTTANAILESPCSQSPLYFVAVLDWDGTVKLVSYLDRGDVFRVDSGGRVWAGSMRIDLATGPKVGCVVDAIRAYRTQPGYAPGELLRVKGGGFGPRVAAAATPIRGRFPTVLGNVRVRIDGHAAPMLAVADSEALVSVPFGVREGTDVPVTVEQGRDESDPLRIAVKAIAPELIGGIVNEDGTANTYQSPARLGSTVRFWLTGAGPYTPSLADGEIAGTRERIEGPVTVGVQMDSPLMEAAEVVSAGPVPGLIAGISQIAVRLPAARAYRFSSVTLWLRIGSSGSAPLPAVYVTAQ